MDSDASQESGQRAKVSFFRSGGDWFILVAALLSGLGWGLALSGLLNRAAYAAAGVVALCLALWVGRRLFRSSQRSGTIEVSRIRSRLRRPIFVVYTLILLAALVGGSLYLPSNYDALSYRTPQLLHWLDAGGWRWIETPNSRMNIAPPGFNWLTAPFLILARTDGLSFLANVAAFALLPGFLFEMFKRAGIARRVAWWWTWLLPCAFVFATQAGSVGNDLIGTVYAVAAIALALRARDTSRFQDAALSTLAAALCTGVKTTNLPILLPWLVVLLPRWRLFAARPAASLGIVAIAAAASCVPTTILNVSHTKHWSGDPNDEHRVRQPNPWVGAVSNSVVLATANLQPPLWPIAQRTNEAFARAIADSPLKEIVHQSPRFDVNFYEIPAEENAGLGLGVSALVLLGSVSFLMPRRRGQTLEPFSPRHWPLAIASLVAIVVPICSLSSEGIPRMLAPLVPSALLLPLGTIGNLRLARNRYWQLAAVVSACSAIPALILSPARPLFPWRLLLRASDQSKSPALARAERVYSIYAQRADAFAPLRAYIPNDVNVIWMVSSGDDPETSLWRPFGSRKVKHLLSDQTVGDESSVVVASDRIFRERFGVPASAFAAHHNFTVVGSAEIMLRASGNTELWHVLAPMK